MFIYNMEHEMNEILHLNKINEIFDNIEIIVVDKIRKIGYEYDKFVIWNTKNMLN